ncbi:disease resistance protein RPM1 [Sorghum bicolor]|uniref:disease resistance protein RPM1 n=1 Tax=Sorghum bicolor TaxID=4558 RepID=UPI000B42604D|nr:disease resistance protein RPM1 [Sorghum bicolor]|eukprot:XP_021317799.1 disease resistance protein RPM1 [Sorghum bicolor]
MAKDPEEWRRLSNNISAELEMNPELGMIKTVLQKSYDGLPFDLKSCFLYLSIFPEDHVISRRRLVRRWASEGYSTERLGKSAIEIADTYFMELNNRSLILPFKRSADSRKSMDSCKVHDLLHEIAITKSLQEDVIFRLEEGCNLKSTARHLAISSDWRGDQGQFESSVDLPQLRSLTVFGEFQSFFISKKMRMLRVLDFENTNGIGYHGLDDIGKLLHLRYLSLRGCRDIILLPDSLGKLRQLLTLDIRDTYITTLPKTIVKLQKLQFVHAGNKSEDVDVETKNFTEGLIQNKGVLVPRGIRKMRGLLTLRAVKVGRGNAALQEIRCPTGLRKLGVTGINKRNGLAFCLAIADLKKLESLSVSAAAGRSGLRGSLDALSTPPENLLSLKLYGSLDILPEWVAMLQKLVKLRLSGTGLLDPDGAIQLIGRLPKLQILSLYGLSFQCEEICFRSEQTEISFRSIKLLSFEETKIKSVKFEAGTMPKLEQLKVTGEISNGFCISGLECLPSINEVQLDARFPWDRGKFSDCHDSESLDKMIEEEGQNEKWKTDELKKKIREQLSLNENKPILIWKNDNWDIGDMRDLAKVPFSRTSRAYAQYNNELDTLRPSMVNWEPYTDNEALHLGVSIMCSEDEDLYKMMEWLVQPFDTSVELHKLKIQWTQADYAYLESSEDEDTSYDLAARQGTLIEAAPVLDRVGNALKQSVLDIERFPRTGMDDHTLIYWRWVGMPNPHVPSGNPHSRPAPSACWYGGIAEGAGAVWPADVEARPWG